MCRRTRRAIDWVSLDWDILGQDWVQDRRNKNLSRQHRLFNGI